MIRGSRRKERRDGPLWSFSSSGTKNRKGSIDMVGVGEGKEDGVKGRSDRGRTM